ncbi:sulfotransferase [Serinicoccus kebangsaanensis]|uniref:sulfotransferase n=1 Tax=Serinicoccus kebangsaanensis TaxID=2602069 RepID=UPI00124D1794|nr:sulfotransferase [Serinicoccus kebangsaanensis]
MRYAEKDAGFEAFLDRLNITIAAEFSVGEVIGPTFPSGHVVGLPRSGTTFLFQALAASGRVGYPSNLMALFWRSPWVGARLQRQLSVTASTTSLNSVAGRTPEPLDPHEFGYFWRDALGHDTNALEPSGSARPPADLRRALDAISSIFQAPTVYKNFLVPAHLDYLSEVGAQRYLLVERSLDQVAASLVRTRRSLEIPESSWFGIAPPGPWPAFSSDLERVAFQVAHVQRAIESSGIRDRAETLVVTYEQLCRNPAQELPRVLDHLDVAPDVQRAWPQPRQPQDSLHSLPAMDRRALLTYLDHYLGQTTCDSPN